MVTSDLFKVSYTSLVFRFSSCFDFVLVYYFHFRDIRFFVKLR